MSVPCRRYAQLAYWADSWLTHLVIGALVCLFFLSPALFTPWGFGPDYSNHLWLVWQQGLAIAANGHPTLYLQSPEAVLEPLYGFYGGTLYAAVGSLSALAGTSHTYAVYVASYGLSAAMAYGGMWWLGRLLGLTRWVSHLPAFIVVTAAYYLTDAYARGAWPELVALSAVPLVLAGVASLLTRRWRAGSVALFILGVVAMTGSHNITLLWSAIILIPIAILAWLLLGRSRPILRKVTSVLLLALLGIGVNAWFLTLDLMHSGDTQAWVQNIEYLRAFKSILFFDNVGTVLDPLRGTPSQSSTFGLTIAAPVGALFYGLVLIGLARQDARQAPRWLLALGAVASIAVLGLILLMVMPGDWWTTLGAPFTDIQFPYRLAGWLLIAIATFLALALRFGAGLAGGRRCVAMALAGLLVITTIVQAAAQLYAGPRLDGEANGGNHPREVAFENGPTVPPVTYYDPHSYSDSTLPVVRTSPDRVLNLPVPSPGGTETSTIVSQIPRSGPIATNIAGGPYVVQIHGMKVVGRTKGGRMVVTSFAGDRGKPVQLIAVAEAGSTETLAVAITIACLAGSILFVSGLAAVEISGRLKGSV